MLVDLIGIIFSNQNLFQGLFLFFTASEQK